VTLLPFKVNLIMLFFSGSENQIIYSADSDKKIVGINVPTQKGLDI
jgi:hypothetical protein